MKSVCFLLLLSLFLIMQLKASENGIFQGPFHSMVIPDAYHIRSGDLNLDGLTDLIVCTGDYTQGHGYRILLGSGSCEFTESSQASFFRNFDYLVHSYSDITGDGDPDVIFSVEFLYMLYSGYGNGFISHLFSPNPGVGGQYIHDTEDCSGDGFTDFLFSSKKPGQSLHLGLNDGSGISTISWSDYDYYHETDIAALCDMDNDGQADIVAAFTKIDSVAIYPGNGDGTFEEPIAAFSPCFSGTEGRICTAKLNDDDYEDVLVLVESATGAGQMLTYFGTSFGYLEYSQEYLQEADVFVDVESPPMVFDFDINGIPDLALQGDVGWVLPGLPGGSFDDLTTQSLFYIDGGITELDTLDADMDGDLDLVVLRNDSLQIWLNQTLLAGTNEQPAARRIILYPNPVSYSITVDLGLPVIDGHIAIFDVSGRMAISVRTGSTSRLCLDLSDLESGLYSMRVLGPHLEEYKKLLVVRN